MYEKRVNYHVVLPLGSIVQIAQLVERRTDIPKVRVQIPLGPTIFPFRIGLSCLYVLQLDNLKLSSWYPLLRRKARVDAQKTFSYKYFHKWRLLYGNEARMFFNQNGHREESV